MRSYLKMKKKKELVEKMSWRLEATQAKEHRGRLVSEQDGVEGREKSL